MADLGAIGKRQHITYTRVLDVWAATNATTRGRDQRPYNFSRILPTWGYTSQQAIFVGVTGTLSGTVAENGVGVVGAMVCCYYRKTGYFIARTFTTAGGAFSFSGLDTSDAGAYYVVALDPDTGVQYNALIFDRLTAV
jgi:hypothetical protein